jgi:lysine-ketoglutarate reductase/saccharopine dehydrogenase-like protein (TIGR00300 family)
MQVSHEIELEGHIIDSGIMTRIFDKIMDMGGNFEILEFEVGKKKTDTSYAHLRVCADTDRALSLILTELYRLGARDLEVADVHLAPAEGDRVVPKGFYSTTNHPTFVKYENAWLPVEDIKMDSLIVVDPVAGRAFCRTLSKIRCGDLVVIGENGVRVVPPERPREQSTFEFMHGTVSSERPSETIIAQIAREILDLKRRGGKIALVGGPAIIHTGAADAVAEFIRKG